MVVVIPQITVPHLHLYLYSAIRTSRAYAVWDFVFLSFLFFSFLLNDRWTDTNNNWFANSAHMSVRSDCGAATMDKANGHNVVCVRVWRVCTFISNQLLFLGTQDSFTTVANRVLRGFSHFDFRVTFWRHNWPEMMKSSDYSGDMEWIIITLIWNYASVAVGQR